MAKTNGISRRKLVKGVALGGLTLAGGGIAYSLLRHPPGPVYPEASSSGSDPLPGSVGEARNIIIINVDDLGYGDLSCYGSQAIRTPNIDGLAELGVRLTDFHTCDAVCTPSRAGLLTGRYPARMMLDTPLHPGRAPLTRKALMRVGYLFGRLGLLDLATRRAAQGLHRAEITIPEALKTAGYRTGMVGKWHLGDFSHDPSYNPTLHGFDSFFGVPYSNDMHPFPLYRDLEELEADVPDQAKLTELYTREAVEFVGSHGGGPFFLYLAHTFPHRPLFASDRFRGKSAGGLYGDVVEELDWSVGEILRALRQAGKLDETIVFFTSDNGPWYQGSPGPFRGRKGQSFEGGHRVPFLAAAPGMIPAGSVCHAPAVNLDLFPTCLAVAGLSGPEDRIIDGRDITALLTGASRKSPHDHLYLYHHGDLEGVRSGNWKYFRATSHYSWPMPTNKKLGSLTEHTSGPLPLLHELTKDPGEAYNLVQSFPGKAKEMEEVLRRWEAEMESNPLGFLK